VLPEGAVPLVLEMCQPIGGFDERDPGAGVSPSQAHTVRDSDVVNVLPNLRRHSDLGVGTFVPVPCHGL
jgi:hypothetical protein